ncbi:MAG: hypothetical protein R3F23_04280 [Verrucomicrobiia bacterium]
MRLWSKNWKTLPAQSVSRPTFSDLNHDNQIDLLCGGQKGGIQYWQAPTTNAHLQFKRFYFFLVNNQELVI